MATSINIDLSNIGDKVAAAIQQSLEKMVNEKVAAVKDDIKKKDDEPTIAGLREQILANSTWLFPILLKKSYYGADHTPDVKKSELSVLTAGEGTTIRARVVYKINGQGDNLVLLTSADAPNQTEALQKLLGMSSMLLNKKWTGNFYRERTLAENEAADGGFYYTQPE